MMLASTPRYSPAPEQTPASIRPSRVRRSCLSVVPAVPVVFFSMSMLRSCPAGSVSDIRNRPDPPLSRPLPVPGALPDVPSWRRQPGGRSPMDVLRVDDQLTDEERMVRDTVRTFVAERVLPHVAGWFEDGVFPVRELAPELGKLGLLGMHLDGYGCAGMSAVAYGTACRELEAADSGLRSFVSVQGSLAMAAIHKYGSEDQKNEWLPRMAAGEAVGCFGLTEPDRGSDPGDMLTRARRDGSDWILNGSKMWITNGSVADVAVVWAQTDEGIRGFLVPKGTPGFTTGDIHRKMSLRASVTSELVLDDVRLPADAMLPGVKGLRGPLGCLTEARYGIIWGAVGAGRACYEAAVDYAKTREQFGKPIGSFQLTQEKLAWMEVALGQAGL